MINLAAAMKAQQDAGFCLSEKIVRTILEAGMTKIEITDAMVERAWVAFDESVNAGKRAMREALTFALNPERRKTDI
jgi:hypothetical protein